MGLRVLAFADETPMNEDIVFTASDLKNLIYSKGAVYAGFTTLLGHAGMDFSMVDRMIITGGFGQYLNIEKAVTIGLLPDIDRNKFAYMGNSSIVGAYMALLSTTYRRRPGDLQQHDLCRFFKQPGVHGRIYIGPVSAAHGPEGLPECILRRIIDPAGSFFPAVAI
jgi:hypothetical protein